MKKQLLLENNLKGFLQLIAKLSDCMIVVDQLGNIIFMNSTAEGMFRIDKNEIVGQSINQLIVNYQEVHNDESERTKFTGLKKHKLPFSIKVKTHSLLLGGESYGIILVEDVQENQKRMDEVKNLSKELADIKLALDASTIIAITDYRGIITVVNDKFCELSKYSEEELIGQNHRILNSDFHPKDFFLSMWRTICSGNIWKGEIRNKAKDGSLYWVDTTIVPFLNDKGKPYQFVSIRTDITERKNMEMEIQEALKTDFIHTLKNLQNGVIKVKRDANGNFIFTMAEGQLLDEMGLNSEVLCNKTPFDVFTEQIANIKKYHYDQAFKGNRVSYELELSGKLIYVDLTPIKQGDDVIELVGSVHDLSELRTTQRELQENQLHYQSLFENSQDAVITYDTKGHIINMNPRAEEYLGYSKDTIPNHSMKDLIVKEFRRKKSHSFKKAMLGNPQNLEIELVNRKGKKLCFNLTLLPIIVNKQITGIYSIAKDITEQKKIQETNAYLAHHDELTKLPNRRWMEKKLNEKLKQAKRYDEKLAVLFIDLDRFKYINDTLGHYIGDRLLEQMASRLLVSIEENKQFVARMGGDEFMVLCPNIQQVQDAVNIAKAISQNLETPFNIEGNELFITASIGISIYPAEGANAIDLMKHADIALYRAKDQGRNTYQIYSTSMDKKSVQSFILERDLRKAVINNEFLAYLQPKVDALTGEIVSAEALIRWNHPELGLVSPAEFIPLAEETGLIIPLGKWMKKKVCEQLVAWREAGIPLIPISVNISSQRFLKNDFSKDVRQLLEDYQLEGKWLEFEITENSLMRNEEYILQTLKELKELGIKIYIDDFGTGYSSFHYLKTFKLDGIKIDRTFIHNISNESENAGITIAMIKMAQHLKMEVTAEGVEAEEELLFLREQKCTQIQGFLFGRPCSVEEFERNYLNK